MANDHRHFPNKLRWYRKLHRYQQKQVATCLGVAASRLSRWERGREYPNLTHLLTLCALYQTLPTDLYGEYWQEIKEHLKTKQWELFEQR